MASSYVINDGEVYVMFPKETYDKQKPIQRNGEKKQLLNGELSVINYTDFIRKKYDK